VQRLLNSRVIQTKLTINEPGDKYEQEADRVAEQVMRMPNPATAEEGADVSGRARGARLQRMCSECEEELHRQPMEEEEAVLGQAPRIQRMCSECEEELHRQPVEGEKKVLQTGVFPDQTARLAPDVEANINALRGGGQPLPQSVRAFFEPRFGHDFSRVRVHTDAEATQSAQAMNALAYTVGRDVVFGAGRYVPESADGKRLLAHELAHVVQQANAAAVQNQMQLRPTNDAQEAEADQVTSQLVEGTASTPRISISRALRQESIQRYSFGKGDGPVFSDGSYLGPVPPEHRARVEAALNIISRVVNNPRDFPECPRFFQEHCRPGSPTALYDAFNQAVVWYNYGARRGLLGIMARGTPHIGYTDLSYRASPWAIAATLIHELMHVCGQYDHDIADRAKDACGRLPDIQDIGPLGIEISNPIRTAERRDQGALGEFGSGYEAQAIVKEGCAAPSEIPGLSRDTVSLFGDVAEYIIFTDYCSKINCATTYFDDRKKGAYPYIDFLVMHNNLSAKEKEELRKQSQMEFKRPDVLTHLPGLEEFYEVKPNSDDGKRDGREKILWLLNFYLGWSLPYELGTQYMPPKYILLSSGKLGPARLELYLRVQRLSDGFIAYDICARGHLSVFGTVLVAIIGLVILALVALVGGKVKLPVPMPIPVLPPPAPAPVWPVKPPVGVPAGFESSQMELV